MKKIITLMVIVMIFIVGCSQSNERTIQSQPTQQPAVGGGCGVAPSQDNGNVIRIPIASEL